MSDTILKGIREEREDQARDHLRLGGSTPLRKLDSSSQMIAVTGHAVIRQKELVLWLGRLVAFFKHTNTRKLHR